MMDLAWRRHAACKGLDPEIFFPVVEDGDVGDAKAVCTSCAVQQTCLEFALTVREKEGVWGGATEKERRRILRQRRRAS